MNEIRTIAVGRGRKLKSEKLPELSVALEYAFEEHCMKECTGTLESHPRPTTSTMYRTVDNTTTIRQARAFLLSIAHEGFNISLLQL